MRELFIARIFMYLIAIFVVIKVSVILLTLLGVVTSLSVYQLVVPIIPTAVMTYLVHEKVKDSKEKFILRSELDVLRASKLLRKD